MTDKEWEEHVKKVLWIRRCIKITILSIIITIIAVKTGMGDVLVITIPCTIGTFIAKE